MKAYYLEMLHAEFEVFMSNYMAVRELEVTLQETVLQNSCRPAAEHCRLAAGLLQNHQEMLHAKFEVSR